MKMTLKKLLKMKVAQSCPALCDPIDYIVHGILQVRILELVAIPFSRGSYQPRDRTKVSHIEGILYQLTYQGSLFLNYCHAVSYACVSFKYLQEKDEELSVKFSYYPTDFLDP